jgi:phosphoglycerate dehydrogenase-like enzyme
MIVFVMKKLLPLLLLVSAALIAADKKIIVQASSNSPWVADDKAMAGYRKAVGGQADIVLTKNAAEFAREIVDADGVIGGISKELYPKAAKLKWVLTTSAGVEAYSFWPEFVKSGITLTNCKIAQGPTIADHAMAMLLAHTRGLLRYIPGRTEEDWARGPGDSEGMTELPGMTAVVIGVGGIGTQIAIRAHAFGMTVIGVDPKDIPIAPFLSKVVRPNRLNEVLPEADVVFISAPLTPESEGMMGPAQFDLMKKGSYFIAVSRGRIYSKQALMKALDSKKLAGAGLDVVDPEPLPKGDPLWKFDNVIITPHVASRAEGSNRRRVEAITENIGRFARGEELINVVDKEKGY